MSLNPSAFLIPSTAVTSRLIWDLIEARIVVPKFCKTFHQRCCSRCNIIHQSFFHTNWLDFVMSKNLVEEWLISKSEFLYPYRLNVDERLVFFRVRFEANDCLQKGWVGLEEMWPRKHDGRAELAGRPEGKLKTLSKIA